VRIHKNNFSLQTAISKESQIISLLTKGNEAAFDELYHSYSKRLLGHLIKLVKSESIAAELLQDTFLKIWDKRELIDPERSFRSYLFRIAENIVYDFFRKAARNKKLEAALIKSYDDSYSHIEESISIAENKKLVDSLLESLSGKRRQVFQMIKIEERSYEEVGELLHVSPSTINDHVVKATKAIRKNIGRYMMSIMLFLLQVSLLFYLLIIKQKKIFPEQM